MKNTKCRICNLMEADRTFEPFPNNPVISLPICGPCNHDIQNCIPVHFYSQKKLYVHCRGRTIRVPSYVEDIALYAKLKGIV